MKILRTASLGSNFTGFYKRKTVFERISIFVWSLDLKQEFSKLTHLPLTPPLLYLKSFQLLQNTGKPWNKVEHWYRIGDNWLREAVTQRCSLKKVFWKTSQKKTGKHLCQSLFPNKAAGFSIKGFFSKCDQIHGFLWIWSNLLKKSLMKNVNFCAVETMHFQINPCATLTSNFSISK